MSEGDCFRRSSAPHHGKHQPRPADDNEAPNVLSLSSSWCLSHTGAVEDRTIFYADDRFFDELLNDPASAIPNGATQAAVSDEYLHSDSERLASPWLESGGGQDFAPPPSFPAVHDAPSFPGEYMRDSSSQTNAEANEFPVQYVVFQPSASATSSRANVQVSFPPVIIEGD
ncbi:hypothetical protein CPB85DRAFT_290065 [Mucidula mucida]|nr:hypothetical protein CPB85DRAFT_290065 [Mucidula mucida]